MIYCSLLGTDIFTTSTDGNVMWWDTRKLVEPVETLILQFGGYKSGELLGGITLEYESTMVREKERGGGLESREGLVKFINYFF